MKKDILKEIARQLTMANTLKLIEIKVTRDDWTKDQCLVFELLTDMVSGNITQETLATMDYLKNKTPQAKSNFMSPNQLVYELFFNKGTKLRKEQK